VTESEGEHLERAAAWLRQRLGGDACDSLQMGMVLGSGLKQFRACVEDVTSIAFGEVPGWLAPSVEGHGGELLVGSVAGLRVACLTGRVHLYEGYRPAEVVRAVRTLRLLGIPEFLLTNAAGGIGDDLAPGDLMLIRDHINLTGQSPLTGPHEAVLGPRFPDQSHVYDPGLALLLAHSGESGDLRAGVYAGLLGPSYETPAEVQMLRRLGADAVGMSTVHEAIALNAMGAKVCGLSLISNLAAGISESPLQHDEVMETGRLAASRLQQVVVGLCAQRRALHGS
jgi:purine-nucleoside phosphorylase